MMANISLAATNFILVIDKSDDFLIQLITVLNYEKCMKNVFFTVFYPLSHEVKVTSLGMDDALTR